MRSRNLGIDGVMGNGLVMPCGMEIGGGHVPGYNPSP